MTYETTLTKKDGWEAKTDFVIGTVPATAHESEGTRIVRLSTRKNYSGNITTRASCHTLRFHSEQHVFGLGAGGDFSKTVQSVVGKKATEKAIREYHNEALASFPAIIEEAKAYYANPANQAA